MSTLADQIVAALAAKDAEIANLKQAVREMFAIRKASAYDGDYNAPGHDHMIAERWDTGEPCEWCKAWNRLKGLVEHA